MPLSIVCDPPLLLPQSDHYITQPKIIRKNKQCKDSSAPSASFKTSKNALIRTNYPYQSFKVFNYIIHFFFLFVSI
ncbi:hypothetical protein DZA65_02245 [Dickeya dianthicola]|nr:hypothetical protein DDI_2058 [Dickeya dianthicola RNS04.9]AYC19132.1 hypothetical protein DZA65_02245 [Dickeya dianthicola]